MTHSKISITVPEEILFDIKQLAEERQVKLSKLISEALRDKIRKAKEEAFIANVNKVFENQDVMDEYDKITDDIAGSLDVEELPW